jgi:hypothetical protein
LREVARKLETDGDAMAKAAAVIQDLVEGQGRHVS